MKITGKQFATLIIVAIVAGILGQGVSSLTINTFAGLALVLVRLGLYFIGILIGLGIALYLQRKWPEQSYAISMVLSIGSVLFVQNGLNELYTALLGQQRFLIILAQLASCALIAFILAYILQRAVLARLIKDK